MAQKIKIMCIVGTRPEVIRMSPIIKEVLSDSSLELQLVHTGQHYSYEMDEIFFKQLQLPIPKINLSVGSGSHAVQTAKILVETEKVLDQLKPHIVVVFGDTNSTLGVALTAAKMHFPVAHVEAGCRNNELFMAEEINRRMVDHFSNYLFAVSKNCQNNLVKENVPGKVFCVGDPLLDVNRTYSTQFENLKEWEKYRLKKSEYTVVSIHRAENVDDKKRLRHILEALVSSGEKIIFPLHPRTKNRISENSLNKIIEGKKEVILTEPLGYFEINSLIMGSNMIITDSGGLQKEAFFAQKPCIVLRKSTEWEEPVKLKVTYLIEDLSNLDKIISDIKTNYHKIHPFFTSIANPYGDGDSSKKIVAILKKQLCS